MKEKPILFSTPMVQAILDGRKTMTRRIVKFPKKYDCYVFDGEVHINSDDNEDYVLKYPYGQVGDILWVRETFINLQKTPVIGAGSEKFNGLKYWYKADNTKATEVVGRYKPSIHMPREACRIMLEITNIRVERLQDISEQDAINEGITMNNLPWEGWYWMENVYATDCPLLAFEQLWKKINGAESWDANPWVWVIEFKTIDR